MEGSRLRGGEKVKAHLAKGGMLSSSHPPWETVKREQLPFSPPTPLHSEGGPQLHYVRPLHKATVSLCCLCTEWKQNTLFVLVLELLPAWLCLDTQERIHSRWSVPSRAEVPEARASIAKAAEGSPMSSVPGAFRCQALAWLLRHCEEDSGLGQHPCVPLARW